MIDVPARSRVRIAGVVFVWSVGVVLLLCLAAGAWIGVRGAQAVQHLSAAQATAATAVAQIDDPSAASAAVVALDRDTSAARELTGDPIWSAAESLPWVGPQLAAVSELAAAVDDAAAGALTPLASAASGLSAQALRPRDGDIDIALIASLEPASGAAASQLAQVAHRLSEIDRRPLLRSLRDAVSQVDDAVSKAAASADALHRTAVLLPPMLGASGPRSYLVLFQNNAEWRSLGGIVGAVAQIDTRDGRMSLAAQGSSADFSEMAKAPVLPLPDDVESIYDTRPARYIQDVTQVPDFSVGAPVAREMWRRLRGTSVDGVISIDPVALSYILRATGPVTLPDGDTVSSEDAVSLLLHDVYRRFTDPSQQDAYFRATSAAVFQALADGRADPARLVDALRQASAEDRLLVWNADPGEQALLDGTSLQGALPPTDATQTSFGVYLNDGTGAKMDYYLHPGVALGWCGSDSAAIRVTLRNEAPDPASLPEYVTGGGAYGVPAGQVRTGVYVYLPEGARLDSERSTSDGSPAGFAGGIDHGRQVVKWSVQLSSGQQAHLDLRVATPSTGILKARTTPTIYAMETPQSGVGCESGG